MQDSDVVSSKGDPFAFFVLMGFHKKVAMRQPETTMAGTSKVASKHISNLSQVIKLSA